MARRLVKVGLVNLNPTVGKVKGNVDSMIAEARRCVEESCRVVCFPEQSIAGYCAEDLVQWKGFVDAQRVELRRFADETKEFAGDRTVFVVGLTIHCNSALYNCAAVVCNGQILGIVPKEKLPTYGVFYEGRVFANGVPGYNAIVRDFVPFGDRIFKFSFGTMAVEICEDIWSPDGPMRRRCYAGAELVVNISASPWRTGVVETRREMISTRANDNCATVVYVNQVGGNDSLVYDGGGFVCQNGRMLLVVPQWEVGHSTVVIDLDRTARLRNENTTWRHDQAAARNASAMVATIDASCYPIVPSPAHWYPVPSAEDLFVPAASQPPDARTMYFVNLIKAMVLALGDYIEKTGPFKRICIALSGGRDSALVLLIAHQYALRRFAHLEDAEEKAAIRDFIRCYSMPTKHNSEETRSIARDLCEELGVSFKEVPIGDAVEAMEKLQLQMLEEDKAPTPVSLQNLQARVRGTAMLNLGNCDGSFWPQTGNMSEKAVGYTTIGGDMMGAYSLLGNLPKTVEERLLYFMNELLYGYSPIIARLLQTKASAGLAEGQTTEGELMPFPVLDACYYYFAGEKMMPNDVFEIVCQMFPAYDKAQLKEWVRKFVRLFRASIFKWVQAPMTLHLGSLDLDRERALQLPVVSSPEWLLDETMA